MKAFLLSLISFYPVYIFAQQQPTIVSTATDLITQGQYDKAILYVDSILQTDKNNVDALMMKGNIILNRDLLALPEPATYSINDESIFYGTFTPPLANRKVIPAATIQQVETLWKQCLTLDSTRTDIIKGLCTVYAMGLMKDKLLAEILVLKKSEKDDGEQAFRMGEYARKFIERGKFDDGMDVYKFIAEQYPSIAGVRCDIASEYFYEGRMNESLTWLDSTYNFKSVDETSFLNGAFIYSELGYFDNAQDVLNSYSRIYDRKMHQFYYGLRSFADGDTTCFSLLKYFSEMVDSNAYYPEVKLAKQILNYKNGFTLNDYHTVASMEIPDYYKVLIHTRAVKQFPNNCEPFLLYGLYMNSIKNYGAAGQYLEEGDKCKLDPMQTQTMMLNYGFALYMSGHANEALTVLKPITTGTDAFMDQAAVYFCAKAYLQLNKPADAKAYLQSIISATDKTKYGVLAQSLLLTIGN